MAFAKTLLLASVGLMSFSNLIQESDAREVQIGSGRGLMQGIQFHSEISDQEPDDGNEGNEGDEGNEGTFEGDEGGDSGPEEPMEEPMEEMPEEMPEEPMEEPMEEPTEEPMEEPTEEPMEEPPVEEPPVVEEPPAEPPVVEPVEEEPVAEPPVEEAPDAVPAVAAGAAVAAAGAVAAGTVAGAPEEVADAPTDAPLAASPREFEFAETPAAVCETLRDGLIQASPALASVLPSLAPEGEASPLAEALDSMNVSVTVLLPDDETLAKLPALIEAGDADAPEIQAILLNHVLPTALEQEDLLDLGDGMTETLGDAVLDLMIDGTDIFVSLGNTTAQVVESDLTGCAETEDGESVIHRINGIFLPDGLTLPEGIDETSRGGLGEPEDEESAAAFLSALLPVVGTAFAAVMLFL